MKTLVVVATYNGKKHLELLFESMKKVPWGIEADVLVIDGGSTEPDSIEYIEQISKGSDIPRLSIDRIEGGYDTGAYLAAYHRNPDYEKYLFMHDSMESHQAGWIREFTERTKDGVVCPWLTFDFFWDNEDQPVYIQKALSLPDKPRDLSRGIFGPIFCVTKNDLDHMESRALLPTPPLNKIEAQAWERGWAIAFDEGGIQLEPIDHGFEFLRMDSLDYPVLHKYRAGR